MLTGSNISKGSKGMKNIKFSGKAGSADQEAMVEFFLKNLLNVIQERVIWKSKFTILMKLTCFTWMLANELTQHKWPPKSCL